MHPNRPIWQLYAFVAAVLLAGIAIAVLRPQPVLSDPTLTAQVNSAFISHTEDATLHAIAHERAVEIASDFSHTGARDGTAEVLAWSSGSDDPVALAVSQWLDSPTHAAILSDPTYTLIGCGSHAVGNASYFACVLAAEPVVAARTPNPTPAGSTPASGATPQPLPNTAATDFCTRRPDHWKCRTSPAPAPTATPTASATATPTPQPTISPPTPTPTPTPTPPSGDWGPPLTTIGHVWTPNTSLPAKLVRTTDPVYGTHITRIGDAGQRHAYARIQPWSPSEKYLFLHYGGQWLLDGRTYGRIKQLNTPYVATWISDTTMVGTRGSALVAYNVETGTDTNLHTFPVNVSLGEGEGSPSRDFRYWALQGGANLWVYDRTTDTASGPFALGTSPNNVTMSELGTYVIVQYSAGGTGQTNGTWLFTRSGSRVRQIWTGAHHMDSCLDAAGAESVVGITSGALEYYRLSDGTRRNLVALPNVWAWVGHVSCTIPGWVTASPNSYHDASNGHPDGETGNDQLASFDMSKTNSTTGRIWGHEHAFTTQYEFQPQGIQSPSGTRVLFASGWGTGSYYPFVAEK